MHFIVQSRNHSNGFLAFMIAVLEQQVRENYEEALTDPKVDKSKNDSDINGLGKGIFL